MSLCLTSETSRPEGRSLDQPAGVEHLGRVAVVVGVEGVGRGQRVVERLRSLGVDLERERVGRRVDAREPEDVGVDGEPVRGVGDDEAGRARGADPVRREAVGHERLDLADRLREDEPLLGTVEDVDCERRRDPGRASRRSPWRGRRTACRRSRRRARRGSRRRTRRTRSACRRGRRTAGRGPGSTPVSTPIVRPSAGCSTSRWSGRGPATRSTSGSEPPSNVALWRPWRSPASEISPAAGCVDPQVRVAERPVRLRRADRRPGGEPEVDPVPIVAGTLGARRRPTPARSGEPAGGSAAPSTRSAAWSSSGLPGSGRRVGAVVARVDEADRRRGSRA